MALYALVNIVLVAVGIFVHNWTGLIAILVTSFFMSVMFPTIFALGLKDLGPNTNIGGSFLVMAIIGGAVLTPLMGALHSTAAAYVVPLFGYIVVAAFSRYMTTYRSRQVVQSTFEV
jgi:FHS family L-fucose permease-like MFS transporter